MNKYFIIILLIMAFATAASCGTTSDNASAPAGVSTVNYANEANSGRAADAAPGGKQNADASASSGQIADTAPSSEQIVDITPAGGQIADSAPGDADSDAPNPAPEASPAPKKYSAPEANPAPESNLAPKTNPSPEPNSAPETATPQYILPELTDDVYSFATELDGIVYSLPAPYSVFKENGWTAKNTDMDETITGGEFELIEMHNGGHTIYMGFINNSDIDLTLDGCDIGMLHINKNDAGSGTRLTLPGGLAIGAAYEEIIEKYGPETKRSDYDWGIISLQYNEQDSGLEIELDAATMLVVNLNYKHYARREMLPEYTGAPPAAIGGYAAPESIGGGGVEGGWHSFECIYGGDIYKLPAPAAEMVKNGWTFVTDENTMLEANGFIEEIELRKDNQTLKTAMMNPDGAAQPLKYCFVTELSYDRYNTKISLELPGGVKAGFGPIAGANAGDGAGADGYSSIEKIIKAYGEPDFVDDSGSMFINYAYGDNDNGIYFTQSIESSLIVYLAIYTRNAP